MHDTILTADLLRARHVKIVLEIVRIHYQNYLHSARKIAQTILVLVQGPIS